MTGSVIEGVIGLLGRRKSEPDFLEFLHASIGEFRTWEDEGDTFYTGRSSGVEVLVSGEGSVDAVFLFGPGSGEGPEYIGTLPHGLRFGYSRAEVRSLLGQPIESGEGETFLGQVVYPWDKFDCGRYTLHVRYTSDQSGINCVTLAPRKTASAR